MLVLKIAAPMDDCLLIRVGTQGEIQGSGYTIGYARVSTLDHNLALQRDALEEAGCEKIFIEQMSGAVSDRPALREALDYAGSGHTLIVWKLDRLARSMKQLIETIDKLRLRNHCAKTTRALAMMLAEEY